jgi:hypothetical protein
VKRVHLPPQTPKTLARVAIASTVHITDSAIVHSDTLNSVIADSAVLSGAANVDGGVISNSAKIAGVVNDSYVFGNATVLGTAEDGAYVYGNYVVGPEDIVAFGRFTA